MTIFSPSWNPQPGAVHSHHLSGCFHRIAGGRGEMSCTGLENPRRKSHRNIKVDSSFGKSSNYSIIARFSSHVWANLRVVLFVNVCGSLSAWFVRAFKSASSNMEKETVRRNISPGGLFLLLSCFDAPRRFNGSFQNNFRCLLRISAPHIVTFSYLTWLWTINIF